MAGPPEINVPPLSSDDAYGGRMHRMTYATLIFSPYDVLENAQRNDVPHQIDFVNNFWFSFSHESYRLDMLPYVEQITIFKCNFDPHTTDLLAVFDEEMEEKIIDLADFAQASVMDQHAKLNYLKMLTNAREVLRYGKEAEPSKFIKSLSNLQEYIADEGDTMSPAKFITLRYDTI